MNKRCRTSLLLLVTLGAAGLLPSASLAVSLTSVDLNLHAGALTRDSNTGLDWLDLSFTLGMAPGDAATFGNTFEGGRFRYATLGEFQSLLQSAGVAWTGGPTQSFAKGPDLGANPTWVATNTLLSLLGVTLDLSSAGAGDWRSSGWLLGDREVAEIAQVGLLNTYATPSFAVWTDSFAATPTAYSTVGSFLVRDQSAGTGGPSPTPVPEPGTLVLLGSGLAVLAGTVRLRGKG